MDIVSGKYTYLNELEVSDVILILQLHITEGMKMSITVTYTGGTEILATDYLTQWSTGQTVKVDGLTFDGSLYARCEIAKKSKEAMTTRCAGESGSTTTCFVPDLVLAKSGMLVLNLTDITSSSATVKCTIKIPVRAAEMPSDWNPDYSNVVVIQELVDRVNAAVDTANSASKDAENAVAKVQELIDSIPSDYQEAIEKMWKESAVSTNDYLKSGDNLNSITKACTRISTGSDVTSGVLNVPSSVTGQFIIYTIAAEDDPYRLGQILYTIDADGVQTWTRSGAGSSWTEWNEIHTPVRGVDYWTDADIAVIKAYIDAQGVLPPDIGYEGLSKLVKSGEASRYLPVGSQIITALSGNNLEVPSFAWDVVHHFDGSDYDHPLVTLESGEQVKGMMLQAHRTVPWAIIWDLRQAAIAVVGDMPAGTYHFTVKVTEKWSSGIAGEVGEKTYQFTTTQALSSGAQLMYSGGESTAPTSASLQVFANNTSSTAVETCALSLGSSGTDLGVMTDATTSTNSQAYAKLNNIQRMVYGSNRWSTSQERAVLNGVGTIVQEGTEFDRSWSMVGSTGLLGCLPEEFVSVLGNIARSQELHPWDGGAIETVYDKMFPISAREHYFSNYLSATSDGYKAEGVPLDYWKQLAVASGRTSAWAGWGTYPELITYDSAALTTARYVWLRSASRSAAYAYSVGRVYTSGYVSSAGANTGHFAAPACIIV